MTLAQVFKKSFDEMCGTNDHTYKRTRHQIIASTIHITVESDGYLFKLKDDSILKLCVDGRRIIAEVV